MADGIDRLRGEQWPYAVALVAEQCDVSPTISMRANTQRDLELFQADEQVYDSGTAVTVVRAHNRRSHTCHVVWLLSMWVYSWGDRGLKRRADAGTKAWCAKS